MIYIGENKYLIRWIFLCIYLVTSYFKTAHSFFLKAQSTSLKAQALVFHA